MRIRSSFSDTCQCGLTVIVIAVAFVGLLPSRAQAADADGCTVVLNGKAQAQIVAGRTEPERFAADELRKYVAQITGARLSIGSAEKSDASDDVLITIGSSEDSPLSLRLRNQPEDAYVIQVTPKAIHLAGGSPRASLYAVYDLLERLGCGFPRPGHSYMRQTIEPPGPQEETVPHLSTLVAPPMDVLVKPAFRYRALLCFPMIRDRSIQEIDWMAKNRFNWVHLITNTDLALWEKEEVRAAIMPEIRKRGIHVQGIGHSFFAYMPPSKYFASHPEYFAMMRGERRAVDARGATLCVSNPEVQKLMAENMGTFLDANPEIDIIDLWNNDGLGWCECPRCREMNGVPADSKDAYRSTSRGYLRFVNAVARNLAEKHPKTRVNALAYGLNLHPDPDTPPAPNVVVGIAPWDRVAYAGSDDYYVPVTEPGRVNDYLRIALTNWAKQTHELYVYDYYAVRNEFFPIVDTLRKDYAWYLSLGINMVSSETMMWDEFNLWAYGRLSWNPKLTVRELAKDFCASAHRAAAGPMEQFHIGLERHKWEWPAHRAELGALLKEAAAKAEAAQDATVIAKIHRVQELLARDPQKNWPHAAPPPALSE